MGAVKLFLVEDQALTRQAFARAFTASGKYEIVGECGDTVEAISHPPTSTADVVILDLALNHHHLLEAISKLRAGGVASPILVVSNGENNAQLNAILRAGAQGCIPKQADFDEMENAIDTVSRGQSYTKSYAWQPNEPETPPVREAQTSQQLLSKREHEIFLLLAQGQKNREIGKLLSISTRTVDTHRSNILKKLEVKSNAQLVRMAISEGLLNV